MNIQNFADRLNNVSSAEEAGLMIAEFIKEVKFPREAAKVVAQLANTNVFVDDLSAFIQMLQEVTGWPVSVELGMFYLKTDKFIAENANDAAQFRADIEKQRIEFEERMQFKKDSFFQDAKKLLG